MMNQGYHSDWVDRCDPDIRIPHWSQIRLMYLLLLLCSDITRRKDGPAHAASFLLLLLDFARPTMPAR